MAERTGNVLTFTRRPINGWPKSVYLADIGDGDGCRPYSHIQHPDDTTPEYVRYDLFFAAVAERDKLRRALEDIARQKKTDELETEYDVDVADFETGYDSIIDVARKALKPSS